MAEGQSGHRVVQCLKRLFVPLQNGEDMGDAWRAASVSDIDGSSPRTIGEGAVYEEDAAPSTTDAAVPSRALP